MADSHSSSASAKTPLDELRDAIDLLIAEERALAVEEFLDMRGESRRDWLEHQTTDRDAARAALTEKLASSLAELVADSARWRAMREALNVCSVGTRGGYYFTTIEAYLMDGRTLPTPDEYADQLRAARSLPETTDNG